MTKGLYRSRRRGVDLSPISRRDYRIDDLTVSNIDGATGVAFGTAVLGGLPEGNILILGAVLSCTITEASASITNDFEGDVAVGSAPTADSTLAGAEVDIIPSTAIGPASSSVATVRAVSSATQGGTIIDNTAADKELNLNLLIDDADISADDQSVTVSGVLHLVFAKLGDD